MAITAKYLFLINEKPKQNYNFAIRIELRPVFYGHDFFLNILKLSVFLISPL